MTDSGANGGGNGARRPDGLALMSSKLSARTDFMMSISRRGRTERLSMKIAMDVEVNSEP